MLSLKDACWLLYLYPGRWTARLAPRLILRLQVPGRMLARAIARRERRRLAERMRRAGFDEANIEAIIDRYLDLAVGRALTDLVLDRVAASLGPEQVVIEGLEHLEAARAGGRGAILLSGHFFASRLAKRVLARRGLPVLSVRHAAPRDPGIGRLGERWLQRAYMRLLHEIIGDEVLVQDADCTLSMLRRLRSGGLVNLHLESGYASETRQRRFLGEQYAFSVNFLRLAQLAGAPLVPFWFSGDHRQLRIVFEPAVEPWPDAEQILGGLLDRLERQVRARPADYDLWMMI